MNSARTSALGCLAFSPGRLLPTNRCRGGRPRDHQFRPRLAVSSGRGRQRPERRYRRRVLAATRRAARLEHRRPLRSALPGGRRRRISQRRHRLVSQDFRHAPGSQRPPRLDRVRRRLHGQRRLAQRQAPGPASLRLHELLLRPDRRPQAPGPERPGRAAQRRATLQPLVLRGGHLPPRAAASARSRPRGPLGNLRHHADGHGRCGRSEDRHPRRESRPRGGRGATLDRDHRARRQSPSRRRRAAQAGHCRPAAKRPSCKRSPSPSRSSGRPTRRSCIAPRRT